MKRDSFLAPLLKRPLLLVFLVALLARWGVALVTERYPIFPAYAYADAELYDREASLFAGELLAGRPIPYRFTPGRELYTNWVVFLYYFLGHRPIIPRLVNGLFAALAICLWCLITRKLCPPGVGSPGKAALAGGLALALWPTSVFYSAQNTKEAMMLLLLAAACGLFLLAGRGVRERPWPAAADAAPIAGAIAIFLAGFLRDHLVPLLGGAMLVGLLAGLWRDRGRARALAHGAWACLWLVIVLTAFRPASSWIQSHPFLSLRIYSFDTGGGVPFMKSYIPPSGRQAVAATGTPAWLSQARKARQASDQEYARQLFGRQVQSQIFTDLEFRSWWDVVLFLPRGAFTVLFQPLPGLYPLAGSPARLLTSLENVGVLAACLVGFLGLRRWAPSADRAPLALFFAAVWLGSALLEVDLGSATRHRLMYLPFLVPFAAWEAERRLAAFGRSGKA